MLNTDAQGPRCRPRLTWSLWYWPGLKQPGSFPSSIAAWMPPLTSAGSTCAGPPNSETSSPKKRRSFSFASDVLFETYAVTGASPSTRPRMPSETAVFPDEYSTMRSVAAPSAPRSCPRSSMFSAGSDLTFAAGSCVISFAKMRTLSFVKGCSGSSTRGSGGFLSGS